MFRGHRRPRLTGYWDLKAPLRRTRFANSHAERLLGLATVIGGTCLTLGCSIGELDSFMDPSVVGRWEHTPTIVPILERIDSIESDTGEFIDVTQIVPEDLQPSEVTLRIAAGDVVEVIIFEFQANGTDAVFNAPVRADGTIDLPRLPGIEVAGTSAREAEARIREAVARAGLLDNAEVSVNPLSQRDQTFGIFGSVPSVGRFIIPSPDYRILDALTDAGGVNPVISEVYVIREITLAERDQLDRAVERNGGDRTIPRIDRSNDQNAPDEGDVDLRELIDILTEPESGAFGAVGTVDQRALRQSRQQRAQLLAQADTSAGEPGRGPEPVIDLFDDTGPASDQAGQTASDGPLGDEPPGPIIDLPEQPIETRTKTAEAPAAVQDTGNRWMFVDGRWVKVVRVDEPVLPVGADPLSQAPQPAELVTQRVIEVPTAPLFQGVSQYNIVIRPGDVINVPAPPQGVVYVSGPGIARPGTYNLPFSGRLTLKRLIAAAGGFSAVGIPERVDITRMVGNNREGTVRVNVRSIYEGTQPDLFVKADDLVNFGTNFWATPLAAIRGGFRASYGFGFLVDRNFGSDVFGPPPTADNP